MALTSWGKGLWQICMHHWRIHAKVEFTRFPPDSELGGIHSITFDAELRNVGFPLISFMGFPAILSALQPFQICIYNIKYSKLTFSHGSHLMGKRFMANLHASFESTCKSRIYKISTRCQNKVHSTTHKQYTSYFCPLKWWCGLMQMPLNHWTGGYIPHLNWYPNIKHITATSNLHLQYKI